MADRTIVILIDALGYSLCRARSFAPAGLEHRARLRTVLGFSQAALATIFTARTPGEHGLWMMYAFRESGGPLRWLSLLPRGVSARRRTLRRVMTWYLRRVYGVRGYFSLYEVPREVLAFLDLPARGDIFAPGGAGGVRTIFDELARRNTRKMVWDYRDDEERSFAELEEAAAHGGEEFLLLYTAGLDAELHRSGSGGVGVAERLDRYRKRIERVVEHARDCGAARVFVLGDHGMCDVVGRTDVMSRLDGLGLQIPSDYIPFYDSTMARFRVFSEAARSRIAERLAGASGGRILDPSQLRALDVASGSRFGDIVFLADPGVVIAPSFMGAGAVAGMHGYHPDTEDMYSVMFSNVPLPAAELALTDVARVLCPGFEPGGEEAP